MTPSFVWRRPFCSCSPKNLSRRGTGRRGADPYQKPPTPRRGWRPRQPAIRDPFPVRALPKPSPLGKVAPQATDEVKKQSRAALRLLCGVLQTSVTRLPATFVGHQPCVSPSGAGVASGAGAAVSAGVSPAAGASVSSTSSCATVVKPARVCPSPRRITITPAAVRE